MLPERLSVSGTQISQVALDQLLGALDRPPSGRARVVTFCNVHSVMTARQSGEVAAALDSSDIASPDGMPIAWWIRWVHRRSQLRVFGPGTMDAALRYGIDRGWRHFMYGSTEQTLTQLTENLEVTHPGVHVCGTYAPPFRPLTSDEHADALDRIRAARPTIVWVGLGMPKQELWMRQVREELPGMTLAGVGAAFDMLAGRVPQAPPWMRTAGLEWLFRLSREPRRLWRRYTIHNPVFMFLLAREVVATRIQERRG
ncbi:WecB/TagA/CpsF family glycosyltransferase [soil metagenome]